MAYAFATAVLLGCFWAAPNVAILQWLIVAAVGFALYGPQMLIGLCGAEVVRKPAVSAAQGFLGWVSYLGAPYILLDSFHFSGSNCISQLSCSGHHTARSLGYWHNSS